MAEPLRWIVVLAADWEASEEEQTQLLGNLFEQDLAELETNEIYAVAKEYLQAQDGSLEDKAYTYLAILNTPSGVFNDEEHIWSFITTEVPSLQNIPSCEVHHQGFEIHGVAGTILFLYEGSSGMPKSKSFMGQQIKGNRGRRDHQPPRKMLSPMSRKKPSGLDLSLGSGEGGAPEPTLSIDIPMDVPMPPVSETTFHRDTPSSPPPQNTFSRVSDEAPQSNEPESEWGSFLGDLSQEVEGVPDNSQAAQPAQSSPAENFSPSPAPSAPAPGSSPANSFADNQSQGDANQAGFAEWDNFVGDLDSQSAIEAISTPSEGELKSVSDGSMLAIPQEKSEDNWDDFLGDIKSSVELEAAPPEPTIRKNAMGGGFGAEPTIQRPNSSPPPTPVSTAAPKKGGDEWGSFLDELDSEVQSASDIPIQDGSVSNVAASEESSGTKKESDSDSKVFQGRGLFLSKEELALEKAFQKHKQEGQDPVQSTIRKPGMKPAPTPLETGGQTISRPRNLNTPKPSVPGMPPNYNTPKPNMPGVLPSSTPVPSAPGMPPSYTQQQTPVPSPPGMPPSYTSRPVTPMPSPPGLAPSYSDPSAAPNMPMGMDSEVNHYDSGEAQVIHVENKSKLPVLLLLFLVFLSSIGATGYWGYVNQDKHPFFREIFAKMGLSSGMTFQKISENHKTIVEASKLDAKSVVEHLAKLDEIKTSNAENVEELGKANAAEKEIVEKVSTYLDGLLASSHKNKDYSLLVKEIVEYQKAEQLKAKCSATNDRVVVALEEISMKKIKIIKKLFAKRHFVKGVKQLKEVKNAIISKSGGLVAIQEKFANLEGTILSSYTSGFQTKGQKPFDGVLPLISFYKTTLEDPEVDHDTLKTQHHILRLIYLDILQAKKKLQYKAAHRRILLYKEKAKSLAFVSEVLTRFENDCKKEFGAWRQILFGVKAWHKRAKVVEYNKGKSIGKLKGFIIFSNNAAKGAFDLKTKSRSMRIPFSKLTDDFLQKVFEAGSKGETKPLVKEGYGLYLLSQGRFAAAKKMAEAIDKQEFIQDYEEYYKPIK